MNSLIDIHNEITRIKDYGYTTEQSIMLAIVTRLDDLNNRALAMTEAMNEFSLAFARFEDELRPGPSIYS